MSIEEYTEFLVKSICEKKDLVKVKSYEKEEDITVLDIVVPEDSMGAIMGRDGRNIKSIKTLVNAYAYLQKKGRIEINIDTF